MDQKSVYELASRLNEIIKELNGLELQEIRLIAEHDEIIYELWKRLPGLRDNPDMQPKKKVRKKDGK